MRVLFTGRGVRPGPASRQAASVFEVRRFPRSLKHQPNIAFSTASSRLEPVQSSSESLALPRHLSPRRALLLLSVPVPPIHWPSHLDLASPLLSRASKSLKPHAIAVNAIYDGASSLTSFPAEERYPARLFWPDGTHRSYPAFDRSFISSNELRLDVAYRVDEKRSMRPDGMEELHEVLVCTHGSRDCRCSDRGTPLVDALREEVGRRGMSHRIKVSEIAHVGGHKYAANAILLPSLDMLSNLTAEHAPALVKHLLAGRPSDGGMWKHWRGRYGLSEEDQGRLWASVRAGHEELGFGSTRAREKEEVGVEVVKLRFRTFESEVKEVDGRLGEDLLDVGRREGLPALEGVCGGNLECATCHLYLPPGTPVPAPSEEELDMLGYALGYRDGESRLGCQIRVTPELAVWAQAGGIVGLPRF